MEENKTGFFSEAPNTRSLTRLITFIWALWAVALSGWVYFHQSDWAGAIAVFTAISAIAGVTKVSQKSIEGKASPSNNNDTPNK